MLHQRKGRGSENGNGAVGGGGGLSLSMGDDGDAYRSSTTSPYGAGSSRGVGGGGAGYGYTGYPPPQAMHQQARQQSARSVTSARDASDKYRKGTMNAQSAVRSWMIYLLLIGLLIVTMIFSKVRYTSLYTKYEALEKNSRNRASENADRERIRQLEKELREAKRAKSMVESEQKKAQRELTKVQKDLQDHQESHHHESSLTDDQIALLDPEHQKFLKDKETEFMKAYDGLTAYIQEESRREVLSWLGEGPYKVKLTIELPEDRKLPPKAKKPIRAFVIELADLDTMPHSVHIFLEQVAAHLWDNTAFIINPGHVIQAAAVSGDGSVADKAKLEPFIRHRLRNVAFQEYNATYPHDRWTVGFAGRPGGPDFYINTQNNTIPHGPGGQKHHKLTNDADPCFGKVVEGINVVKDVMKRPTKRSLYIKRITIKKAEIVAPVLQHDPHDIDEEDVEESDANEEDPGNDEKKQQSKKEDEPDSVPDYVNRDKGTEEETE